MGRYETFPQLETQAMIAECGFRVAEYLHDEGMGSLVLVDQAARNLHIPIRAAWDYQYPDETKPSVYFLDPGGFMTPDIHGQGHYIHREHKMEYTNRGIRYGQYMIELMLDPFLGVEVESRALRKMLDDFHPGRRAEIASEATTLVARTAQQDERFNGRVLVLDACRHSGASAEGIVRALKDIGVVDVRSGVVNNIRNKRFEPDYIVFDDTEIEDVCKPYGTQSGIDRTEQMIPRISTRGLSHEARQAKRDLHRMSKELPELRAKFAGISEGRELTNELPPEIIEMLMNSLGGKVDLRTVIIGKAGSLILPLTCSTEHGSAGFVDDNIERPQD